MEDNNNKNNNNLLTDAEIDAFNDGENYALIDLYLSSLEYGEGMAEWFLDFAITAGYDANFIVEQAKKMDKPVDGMCCKSEVCENLVKVPNEKCPVGCGDSPPCGSGLCAREDGELVVRPASYVDVTLDEIVGVLERIADALEKQATI